MKEITSKGKIYKVRSEENPYVMESFDPYVKGILREKEIIICILETKCGEFSLTSEGKIVWGRKHGKGNSL